MKRSGITIDRVREALAWLGAKASRLKFRLRGEARRHLHLLKGLDALAIGIEGKRALWQLLAATPDLPPAIRDVDYARLIARAVSQRERVEQLRLQAARSAFGPS